MSGLSRSKLLSLNADAILLKVLLRDAGSEQTGYVTHLKDENGLPVGILTCQGVPSELERLLVPWPGWPIQLVLISCRGAGSGTHEWIEVMNKGWSAT